MEYSTPYNVDMADLKEQDLDGYIKRTLSLPEEIGNVFFAYATAEFVEDKLGTSLNLSREQKDNITRIIRDICLGDLYIGNIVLETQKRLSVQPSQAQLIAANVVSQLLMPALEDIKKMESEKFTATPPTPPAPTASKPVAKAASVEFDEDYVPPVIDLRNRDKQAQEYNAEEI